MLLLIVLANLNKYYRTWTCGSAQTPAQLEFGSQAISSYGSGYVGSKDIMQVERAYEYSIQL